MKVGINEIERIINLSKLTKKELRKLNPERAYDGHELTRHQLIFQIVFLMDAPDK